MGRKLLESVATFSGYELDKLQKDFTVERHELEDGTLEIISPIEVRLSGCRSFKRARKSSHNSVLIPFSLMPPDIKVSGGSILT